MLFLPNGKRSKRIRKVEKLRATLRTSESHVGKKRTIFGHGERTEQKCVVLSRRS